MHEIIDALSDAIPSLSPQMQRAAGVILDNPGAVAVDSMRTMAARADVSPPTMLRLAQRLGYGSYEAFRDVFKKSVARGRYGDRADGLRRAADKGGIPGLVEATVASANVGMNRFHDPLFVRDVERAADTIIGAQRAFVVASGASFGQAVSFHYVCRMALPDLALASGLGIRPVDQIAAVSAGDVVIAVSTAPYAASTLDAAEYAQRRGATIVAVTDRRTSPLAMIAGASVIVGTGSPHYFPSMVSLNATLEILSAVIMVKRGDAAVAAITEYEEELRRNGYYREEGI